MTAPDPKTVREIAREVIERASLRRDYIGSVISDHAAMAEILASGDRTAYGTLHAAVVAEQNAAVVTVEWPDEQQPADVVTAEQQQDGAAARLAALLSHLDGISRRAKRARPGDTRTERQIVADFVRQSVEPEQLREGLRAVLAERTALAARVAELESEREADAWDVRGLLMALIVLGSRWPAGLERRANRLRERFADRIAALDANTDGGAE